MSHGIIKATFEAKVTQWEIINFSSLCKTEGERIVIVSPLFSAVGCTWRLKLYRNCVSGRYMSVCLVKGDPYNVAAVTFSIGIKTQDGIVNEETSRRNRLFEGKFSSWGWSMFLDLEDLQKRKAKLAPSDTLVLTCRLEREVLAPEEATPNPELVHYHQRKFVELESLSSDFKDLLRNERTCDFTIEVQDKEFRAHRAVLSARSPVFCAMFEHDTAEARNGVMKIPDCCPEFFGEFLKFIYTGKVEDVSFDTAYHLYAIAEKYDSQRLKSFCAGYLRQDLSADTVCQVVVLADLFGDHHLQSAAQDYFNKNYQRVFPTPEWTTMMENNCRLANKLLIEMSSSNIKNP